MVSRTSRMGTSRCSRSPATPCTAWGVGGPRGAFFPLLSDFWPHGEVARRYGVFSEDSGAPLRATFLIDRDGRVAWLEVNAPGEARDFSTYRAALAELRDRTR